jgi:hypothetical protein
MPAVDGKNRPDGLDIAPETRHRQTGRRQPGDRRLFN